MADSGIVKTPPSNICFVDTDRRVERGWLEWIQYIDRNVLAAVNESITSSSDGVAASVSSHITFVTTDGEQDLNNVTLADGTFIGQRKLFVVKAVGHVGDSLKITPDTFVGGDKITFAASPLGKGCQMVWSSAGWVVSANNGGTIS